MPTISPLSPVLVTGASGKTGTRVTRGLEARGVAVRAASRSGPVPFDWDDRATWGPALEGAAGLSIAYAPDLAVPGAADTVAALAAMAVDAGVRRIVLLSGRGEEDAELAERLVRDAAPDATIVRAAFFMQNFSESVFLEGILEGELALPVGDVPEPFVDVEDVAAAMVAALSEEGHAGRLYEVTGPRMLTWREAVAEIGRASGRDDRLRRGPAGRLRRGARRGRPGARGHRAADVPVHGGVRRPQRLAHRRRAGGPRPAAAGLRRLRGRRRGERRVGSRPRVRQGQPDAPKRSVRTRSAGWPRATSASATASTKPVGPQM